jgi:hypothetical protein
LPVVSASIQSARRVELAVEQSGPVERQAMHVVLILVRPAQFGNAVFGAAKLAAPTVSSHSCRG